VRSSFSWCRSRSLTDTRHHRPAKRIIVANASFIVARSLISRGITFVRRRSSNERSARFVVLTRIWWRTGTRWIESSASMSSVKQIGPGWLSFGSWRDEHRDATTARMLSREGTRPRRTSTEAHVFAWIDNPD
jgi:hypothetical protein